MSRRYHSKSRLGCKECKRRHIKCDEARPICVNCSVSRLQCIYATVPAPVYRRETSGVSIDSTEIGPRREYERGFPGDSVASPSVAANLQTLLPSPSPGSAYSHGTRGSSIAAMEPDVRAEYERGLVSDNVATPSASTQTSLPTTPSVRVESAHPPVNMHHMELLSHFILETSLIFGPAHSSATRMSLAITISTPYLINQILALAALHLSYLRPGEAQKYAEEAAVFQADSLSSLNSATVEVNKDNCIPMLFFSALLGIYTLADAVITSDGDNCEFLDKYITYLDVHRGVHAVVAPFWSHLRQTELSPFLETALEQHSQASYNEVDEVCTRLQRLLESADMSATSLRACQDAVQNLVRILGLITHAQASEQPATADTIYSWPILLSSVFTGLLAKRNPEALIILAHYAVVLHERRDVWVVGNSGRWLIKAITTHLGSYWKDWLAWPNNALLHANSNGRTLFLANGNQ